MNKKIKNITLLDTSIATYNVGDEIIMDAVQKELFGVFKNDRFIKLPTHEVIGKTGVSLIRNSTHSIVGGSNILSSFMNQYKQWKITLLQALLSKNKAVLMGVGWRDYQGKPNLYTKILLNKLLDKKVLHSVRDSYTEQMLQTAGFKNVINTACPTMWQLTESHCLDIPTKKASSVVFTLTDYNKDKKNDGFLIKTLFENYNEVYYWVQGKKDMEYLMEFGDVIKNIKIIAPNLKSYDDILTDVSCDYVGTRLHGGVRALQHKRRTIIIGIDNRAIEKKKDFNINVVERSDIQLLPDLIQSEFKTEIQIPLDNIKKWKNQFSK